MGACLSCLGLGRRGSEDDETDSLLPSSSRQHPHSNYGTNSNSHPYSTNQAHQTHASGLPPYDSPSTHDTTNASTTAAELHTLRINAVTLEDICSDTADKLIDVSEGFGRSKIDEDFERLFSEVFEGGLLNGLEGAEGQGDGNEGQGGKEGEGKGDGKEGEADIRNAKDEGEWFRAIIKAARKQQSQQQQSQPQQQQEKSASGTNNNDTDIEGLALDKVVEIAKPLVFDFDDELEDEEDGEVRLLE